MLASLVVPAVVPELNLISVVDVSKPPLLKDEQGRL